MQAVHHALKQLIDRNMILYWNISNFRIRCSWAYQIYLWVQSQPHRSKHGFQCHKHQIMTPHSCRSSISGCTQNAALFSQKALQTLRVIMNPSQGLKALLLQMVRVGIIIEIVVSFFMNWHCNSFIQLARNLMGLTFFQDKNWILTLQIWAIDSDVEAGSQRETERESNIVEDLKHAARLFSSCTKCNNSFKDDPTTISEFPQGFRLFLAYSQVYTTSLLEEKRAPILKVGS